MKDIGYDIHTIRRHLEYPQKTMFEMIEENKELFPNAPAFEFYDQKVTFSTFVDQIEQAARVLKRLGVNQGEPVTIVLPNVPQALVIFYAVNRLGAIANMVHPLSAENEIRYYLKLSKSYFLFTLDMFYEKARKAGDVCGHDVRIITARIQDELPFHLKVLYVLRAGHPYLKFPKGNDILWTKALKDDNAELPEVVFDPKRTSVILYSGGTSGIPKGICLSDLNFNALALQCREAIQQEFDPGLTMLSCMPMFHGFGLGINIHAMLVYGLECILMPNFNIQSYSKMLKNKKPSFIAGVPTIFEALLHAEELKDLDMSFLKGMFCGGDSLPVELKRKIDAFLKEHNASIQIREGYGLTECVTASCLTPRDFYKEKSIGLPFPDTEYDIVEPGTDNSLPPLSEGEIVIKGPTLMLGYLNNEEETANALKKRHDGDVWLYTGDLGYMDEEGYVYFSQRIKRMIITNGFNVYPERIENEIDKIDGVIMSCVIGVRDSRRGQKVKAFIVTDPKTPHNDKTREKILNILQKSVAGYALPKEIEFRDELPRTLVGKIAYHALEEEENAKSAQ